jgi:hypothetical protein
MDLCELDLGGGLVEHLALSAGNIKLALGGHAGPVTSLQMVSIIAKHYPSIHQLTVRVPAPQGEPP